MLPDHLARSTKIPVLIVAAGREQWNENECGLWDDLRGPRTAVNLKGAEHVALSDAVWLTSDAIGAGSVGPKETIAAMRDYVAAFLDANLGGKALSPLLTGPFAKYPAAALTTREQPLCSQQ